LVVFILFILLFFAISNCWSLLTKLEKGVEAEIASFENKYSVDIDWISMKILQPSNYIKHWRFILWDKVFRVYFDDKGNLKFVSGLDLTKAKVNPIAIKRVVYR
jgi:hypothetical protein